MNSTIVETMTTQLLQIIAAHLLLPVRELFGEGAQRMIRWTEGRGSPIASHRVHQGVRLFCVRDDRLDLFPEVMRVRLRSVVAVQLR